MIKIKISYQNEEEKQRTLQALIKSLKNVKISKEQVKKGHKNIYINAE